MKTSELSMCMGHPIHADQCKHCARMPKNKEDESATSWIDWTKRDKKDGNCTLFRSK